MPAPGREVLIHGTERQTGKAAGGTWDAPHRDPTGLCVFPVVAEADLKGRRSLRCQRAPVARRGPCQHWGGAGGCWLPAGIAGAETRHGSAARAGGFPHLGFPTVGVFLGCCLARHWDPARSARTPLPSPTHMCTTKIRAQHRAQPSPAGPDNPPSVRGCFPPSTLTAPGVSPWGTPQYPTRPHGCWVPTAQSPWHKEGVRILGAGGGSPQPGFPHTLQGPQGGRQLLAAFLDTSQSYLRLKCPRGRTSPPRPPRASSCRLLSAQSPLQRRRGSVPVPLGATRRDAVGPIWGDSRGECPNTWERR